MMINELILILLTPVKWEHTKSTQYLGVVTRDTRDGWITIYRQMEVKIFIRSENIYTALATVCCFVKLCWT